MSKKVITNKTQYQRLLDLLQENPEIAQGYTKATKEEVAAFWDTVKEELNSLGPPLKDASSWRKVWLDWKAYIKRKLVENKKEIKATGGGMNRTHSFSDLEEIVIKLTGLETSTSEFKSSRSFGINSSLEDQNQQLNEVVVEDNQNPDVSMSSDVADSGSVRQRRRLPTTFQQSHSNDTACLLREQMKLQKEFYRQSEIFWEKQNKNADDISSSLRRINRGVEKLSELKKKCLKESQRHNKIKEELLQRKIELKLKVLEIEESKY
ncbi:uncharacterized protein LOC129940627 [Eupeodes corollae]|uniref:uncharacterized protein LOC129940627 n=1 Tax=Eupeodes corollae TaxID=290404 RepID=UPI0024919683|nr:uncharacterized protein LOC129940627 [Eupeodes corollae]